MPNLETCLLIVTVAAMGVGGWGILVVQTARPSDRLTWGHGLFLAALLGLGASSVVAAFHHADGLVLLGLAAGLMIVGMLWETGHTSLQRSDADSPAEKL